MQTPQVFKKLLKFFEYCDKFFLTIEDYVIQFTHQNVLEHEGGQTNDTFKGREMNVRNNLYSDAIDVLLAVSL